jgi:hypothetical protein
MVCPRISHDVIWMPFANEVSEMIRQKIDIESALF